MGVISPSEFGCEVPFLSKSSVYELTLITSKRSSLCKISRTDFFSVAESVPIIFRQLKILKKVTDREAMYPFCSVMTFKKGETIVPYEVQSADYFYIVYKGSVLRESDSMAFKAQKYFGEDGLISKKKPGPGSTESKLWMSVVTAQERCTILAISAEGFAKPEFAGVCQQLSATAVLKSDVVSTSTTSALKKIGHNRRRSFKKTGDSEIIAVEAELSAVFADVLSLETIFGSGKSGEKFTPLKEKDKLSTLTMIGKGSSYQDTAEDETVFESNPMRSETPQRGKIKEVFVQAFSISSYFGLSQDSNDYSSEQTPTSTASNSSDTSNGGGRKKLQAFKAPSASANAMFGNCLGWSDIDNEDATYELKSIKNLTKSAATLPKSALKKSARPSAHDVKFDFEIGMDCDDCDSNTIRRVSRRRKSRKSSSSVNGIGGSGGEGVDKVDARLTTSSKRGSGDCVTLPSAFMAKL